MNRTELSRRAQVHLTTILRLENGTVKGQKLKGQVVEQIATALQVPVEYLRAAGSGATVEVCNNSRDTAQLSLFQIRDALTNAQEEYRKRLIKEQANRRRTKQGRARQAVIERMRGYIASSDPILMSKALNWIWDNPKYLDQVL